MEVMEQKVFLIPDPERRERFLQRVRRISGVQTSVTESGKVTITAPTEHHIAVATAVFNDL